MVCIKIGKWNIKKPITTEQCEEIQKFYEPYVMKYETKYKVLYQILRQASGE